MNRSIDHDLNTFYGALESSFALEWVPEYAPFVVPNGNGDAPVHRWFHLKEAYSSHFVRYLLMEIGLAGFPEIRVLDPFAGSGTTAISIADAVVAGELDDPVVYGIECNPFLHLLASTKLASLQSPPRQFECFALSLVSRALASRSEPPPPPGLSTFHRSDYFDRADIHQLMRLRGAIHDAEACGADPVLVALGKVCLGSIVEAVGNLRRDGRTLRFVFKQSRPAPMTAFLRKAEQIEADLPRRSVRIGGRVLAGDGRLCSRIGRNYRPFDLIVFSPPYPNNIDYTEVYKLENWLLGFIADKEGFTEERLKTVYSHPSILRPDPLPSPLLSREENSLIARIAYPLEAAVPDDRYRCGRIRMIKGYIHDMYLTMRSAAARLSARGWVVYVVGNSVHGRSPNEFVIAADILVAELAAAAGLAVERIAVARQLRRRTVTSPYLRESVVFLRKKC